MNVSVCVNVCVHACHIKATCTHLGVAVGQFTVLEVSFLLYVRQAVVETVHRVVSFIHNLKPNRHCNSHTATDTMGAAAKSLTALILLWLTHWPIGWVVLGLFHWVGVRPLHPLLSH